jgi:FdhD protein
MSAVDRPPRPGPSTPIRVVAVDGADTRRRQDRLAGEEPLEIRVSGPGQPAVQVAVTMRTPGHDFELAAGFLATEGLLAAPDELETIRYCADVERAEQQYNVLTVELRRSFDAARLQRNFYATSSCGVCGKASIEQVAVQCAALAEGPTVARETLFGLPDLLRERQRLFESTGGLHAAGLFSASGELLGLREDVGRHNAMDKLLGERFLEGAWPLSQSIVLVSGRASFELVQKAAVAGVPILCAVSAPSSLAVDTARELGMTLVGFLRGQRFNVYAHAGRIAL